jgi:DNA-binding response OmpR family regulator
VRAVSASAQLVILADHPKLQQLYAHRLREHGYRVEVASDIEGAIVATIVRRPKLLIAEWLLGRGHGLELAHRLHAVPAAASTPILFLTDQAVLPLSVQRGEHTRIELLVRPFPFERLCDTIERMIAPAVFTPAATPPVVSPPDVSIPEATAASAAESVGESGALAATLPSRTRAVIEELVESGLLARRERPGTGAVEQSSP